MSYYEDHDYEPTSCYCHAGNAPCSWCTGGEYCEKHDCRTDDERCTCDEEPGEEIILG